MVYAFFSLSRFFSATTLFYAIFLTLFLVSGKSFRPVISEPALAIIVALFISIYGFKLFKFICIGGFIRERWNNERMRLIHNLSPLLLATFDVLMKLLRVLEIVFMVTPKGTGDEDGACRYHTFRDIPFAD